MREQILYIITLLLCLTHATSNVPVAVYWGQVTKGTEQNSLGYYCESESVDTVILSFVSVFGKDHLGSSKNRGKDYELNLSDRCSFDGERYDCPHLGSDIKRCQKLGKKVLISFGGEQENPEDPTYGFADDEEAEKFASTIWNHFGEGRGESVENRPFGDAVVDGFDIDSESHDQTGYLTFVKKLSEISRNEGSKDYIFSSAPQCTFPDKSNSELIDNFELDYIFIQFYNNECNLYSRSDFNFHEWSNHMLELGYSKTKLFIGLPSADDSAATGFVDDVALVNQRIEEIQAEYVNSFYFGGMMFWDASKGFHPQERDTEDESYIYKVWKNLGGSESSSNETDVDSGASISNSSTPSTASRTHNEADTLKIGGSGNALALLVLFLVESIISAIF